MFDLFSVPRGLIQVNLWLIVIYFGVILLCLLVFSGLF